MSKTAGHTARTPENWCEVAHEAIKLVPDYTETNIPKELVDTYAVLMDACRDSYLIGKQSSDFWLARHKELAAEIVQLAGLPEGSGTDKARKAIAAKNASHEALRDALREALDVTRATYDSGLRRDEVTRSLLGKIERALALAEEQK